MLASLWRNGPILLGSCMLFWAGSVVWGRAAAEVVPPALFTLLRWGGALLLVGPLAWPHLQRDAPALRRHWRVVAALGFLGVAAYNNLVYRGLHSTTAVNALLLQSVTPVVVLVSEFAMFGQRPVARQAAAIAVSLAGVVVIAAQGSLAVLLHLTLNPGDGLVLVAVVFYSIYSVLLRVRPLVHPLSLLAASFAVGVAMLLPMAGFEYLGGARLVPTTLAIGAIVYSCVFPSFLAYLFFNRGVELAGPARAGQYVHLMPVFGIVLAVVFLEEPIHSYHVAGIGLIAAGLYLASRPSPGA